MSGLVERIARDATLDVWKPGLGLMISSAAAMYLAEACARAAVHAALDEAAKVARSRRVHTDAQLESMDLYDALASANAAHDYCCDDIAAAIEALK